jgi:hypothetical protein
MVIGFFRIYVPVFRRSFGAHIFDQGRVNFNTLQARTASAGPTPGVARAEGSVLSRRKAAMVLPIRRTFQRRLSCLFPGMIRSAFQIYPTRLGRCFIEQEKSFITQGGFAEMRRRAI